MQTNITTVGRAFVQYLHLWAFTGDETLDYLAYGRIIQNMGSNNGLVSYQSNRNVVYSCKYHVVGCPKYRRKVLIDQIAARLKTILREVAAEHQATVLELEIPPALACGASVPDHVDLHCEVDPQYGIHRLVQQMKGRSSRLLRQEFPTLRSRLPTLWTNSYFVSSCGGAPLAVIKQYIEDQKNV